jgi:hypothetical protein
MSRTEKAGPGGTVMVQKLALYRSVARSIAMLGCWRPSVLGSVLNCTCCDTSSYVALRDH